MPVLLILLLLGTLTYLYWRRRTTTLTRNCRWRQDRRAGGWRCAFCGAVEGGAGAPLHCRRGQDRG
ncbi:hypothetical protein [Epibacterium sp. Ofav1-8]|uniref:hypothetical protein n=1 Tax=Epibacterium sp. Ofav1-8 TaxID=2917735 RepID=UPI001EF5F5FB|nr:hypothetical protein [Epibacterium sp. Ofav1-8]MCG7622017.1 hypothetical protein [Epibacterium sp. Ofav1-8]